MAPGQDEIIVDPDAPDPDADPTPEADEHGETMQPTEGLGVAIEPTPPNDAVAEAMQPPQPVNRETRVDTLADAQPPPIEAPPMPSEIAAPEPLPAPTSPPPSLAELTEEETVSVHECHLPLLFIQDAHELIRYVNKNEHRLNKSRRKLDVSKKAIQTGYPIFAKAMRLASHYPLTAHWYAAALILVRMGVPIDEEPPADTDAILDGLAVN